MEPEITAPEHGALLVAEIGLDQTFVTLVDVVDQTYRLVARAASPSSFGPPTNDPVAAILCALRQIETLTSRELLRGDDLIYPQDEAGNGVDGVVATTSAVGPLPVAVVGLAQQASVRSATHAARSTYTNLLTTLALDEGGTKLGEHVVALARLKPELIIIAGGLEQGSVSPSLRLAHIVGLLARHSERPSHVIFAGNSSAAEQVQQKIGAAAELEITENLLVQQKFARIEPTRSLLRRYYREKYVAALPGADRLKKLRSQRLGSVVEDQGLMVRFLAQRFSRNVLAISATAETSACLLSSDGHYSEAIFGRLGSRDGALEVLKARGAAGITRWLPFEIEGEALHNRLLNRVLRPRQTPTDLDDLLLDYALLRESLSLAYQALRDERPGAQFDLVIASGLLADAPRPGLAALALLDALQPTSDDSALAIHFYLDRFSLLAASGALAHINVDAAACLLEMDAINNMPLATVIVPRGELIPGKKVAEIELTPTHGAPVLRTVHAGEIVRLPLARGKRATLRVRPVGGIAIGQNQVGAEVLSDEAAIGGSALGVIFDARPRPLALPDDPAQRRELLLSWCAALDALPPAKSFAPSAPAPAETPSNGVHTNGLSQASDHGIVNPEPAVVAQSVLAPAADVATLREELLVEQKPKRGFFRRK